MRYVLIITILALMCCTAQISAAAPSIIGVSTDRAFFNPDTGSVDIHYELADIINGCPVISIYGQNGKVRDITPGTMSSGNHSISWDGTNSYGVGVPDGEYIILMHLASSDSIRQPRLVKVFGSPSWPDEQISGLISGTAINSSGYLYMADTANNSIIILSPEGAPISRFGSGGDENGQFMSPVDVAVNASDYVFVSDDYNARVQAFDPDGRFVASWQISSGTEADYSYAGPIAVNSSGYVYVVSNGEKLLDNKDTPWTPDRQYDNRIQVFSPTGELIKSFGSYGSEDSQFGSVGGLAIDRQDNLYVADLLNHRALVLDAAGNQIASIDHANVGLGDSYNPAGIGIGPAGHIYTVDRDSARVDVFSPIIIGSVKVNVDKTPPLTDAIQSRTMVDGWYNTSISIDLEAVDHGSGVKEIVYILDDGPVHRISGDRTAFVVTNGEHKLDYWSTDNVDNEGNHNSIVIKVDSIPPVTGATLTGTSGNSGWYRSDVVVNLSAEDSGTGVAKTQYSFDEAVWLDGITFTVSTEGENVVYFRSIDHAGNIESTRTLNIMIDKTVPSLDCSLDGSRPQGWFISDVRTTLAPADNESGIEITEYSMDGIHWNTYTSAFTITQGNLNKVYYRTTDVAGNIASGSSYVYFWPTSIPDIRDVINHAPIPVPSSSATFTSIIPVYRLLPSATATVTPDMAPAVGANETGEPSAGDSPDKVRTVIRILKIVAGFASFLP